MSAVDYRSVVHREKGPLILSLQQPCTLAFGNVVKRLRLPGVLLYRMYLPLPLTRRKSWHLHSQVPDPS